MIIRGVELVGETQGPRDLVVAGDRIVGVRPSTAPGDPTAPNGADDARLEFRDAIAFPGLINSHDHLEFDLYPRLGHRHYADYVEWGRDIHARDGALIASIEAVPRTYRARWGGVKNLLAGVTSVGHHGDAVGRLPVRLLHGTPIHSIRLDPKWRRRLNTVANRSPYVIHIGEGTSTACHAEIDRLIRWNLLRRGMIGVHAIAMDPVQAARFRAVVWCPLSNQFLYGRTADIRSLKDRTAIVFGTDSTLTADWNIWNHLRQARSLGILTSRELFDAVTGAAAAVWNRPDIGRIATGAAADLVVARKKNTDRWEAFFAVNPEDILLVVQGGVPVLIDSSLGGVRPAWAGYQVEVGGAQKRVAEDVPSLVRAIRGRGVQLNLGLEAV